MKKLSIIITIITLAFTAVSCETYDDYDTNRPVNIGFPTPTQNIKVPNGGTKDKELEVFISEPANVDRSFNIEVVADKTEVAAENYSLPATVVIPANERRGYFIVTGIDVSLTDEKLPLVLKIAATPEVYSGGQVTISVFK